MTGVRLEGTETGVIHFVYDYDPGNPFCLGNRDWCGCRIGVAHFRNCFTPGIGLFITLEGGGVL